MIPSKLRIFVVTKVYSSLLLHIGYVSDVVLLRFSGLHYRIQTEEAAAFWDILLPRQKKKRVALFLHGCSSDME